MAAISGFQDLLPADQQRLDQWKHILSLHFQRWGFIPLQTPAVERLKILLAKGNDHEIYGLHRIAEPEKASQADLGLRFDLTIPTARYVVDYQGHLTFPYRRFQIGPVWRGERPQEGRYRQFYQCDIDVIGRQTLSHRHDSELIAIMHQALAALEIAPVLGPVKWLINHRGTLQSLLQAGGVGPDQRINCLRWIDKQEKVAWPLIAAELAAQGLKDWAIALLESWTTAHPVDLADLERVSGQMGDYTHEWTQALEDLRAVIAGAHDQGVPANALQISPLLARGLTYYSGVVFEAVLPQRRELGSICAGGRYEHLAQHMACKTPLPGVGVSLGLSRLFTAYTAKAPCRLTCGDILVTVQDQEAFEFSARVAQLLRSQELNAPAEAPCTTQDPTAKPIRTGASTMPCPDPDPVAHLKGHSAPCPSAHMPAMAHTARPGGVGGMTPPLRIELYLEPHPLSKQLKYADAKGYTWVILADQQERQDDCVSVRCMRTGQQERVAVCDLVAHMHVRARDPSCGPNRLNEDASASHSHQT